MAVIWLGTGRFTVPPPAVSDADAQAYLTAVEAADGQFLEVAVRDAINTFVVGCKADGIWSAIKASCILAGARTLSGCLVPLVGAAPTSFNFVAGDYNRKTGLKGNGSTKYLNSNRNNNADPQNSNHNAVFVSTAATTVSHLVGSHPLVTVGGNSIFDGVTGTNSGSFNRSNGTTSRTLPSPLTGLCGHSRSDSDSYTARVNSEDYAATVTSSTPASGNLFVFCRGPTPTSFTNARLAIYSIGESLDLALLDARVTTLINAIAAAIP
jgi:hypothetical protein